MFDLKCEPNYDAVAKQQIDHQVSVSHVST